MTRTEFVMREWLASGTPIQQAHAAHRLTLPFAEDPAETLPPSLVRHAPPGMVGIRTYAAGYTGYGQIAEWLGREIESNRTQVGYAPIHVDNRFGAVNPFVESRLAPQTYRQTLQLAVPETDVSRGQTAVFTMWESTRISRKAVEQLNKAKVVIVPCQWNADGFRASGVVVPIHVVPLGIAPSEGYVPQSWKEDGSFTFGMAARMAHGGIRKGLNEGMRAFVKAFPNGEDVRLTIKAFPDCLPILKVPDDPRITVITETYNPAQMARWYGGIHALFVPSKGEGWGLHTHQAMACGRPVIAAHYGGTAEFFDGRFGWELPYHEEPAGEFYSGQGDWAVPSEEGMVAALRDAFAAPAECRAKGELAAARAAEFTWERTGRELVAVLRKAGIIPERPPAVPQPVRAHGTGQRRLWVERVNTCPYRECKTGCQRSVCHAGRGDEWRQVTLDACIACLRSQDTPVSA